MNNPDEILPVEQLGVDARARFIFRTYTHLAGAIALFTMIEVFLFKSGLAVTIANAMLGTSWLLVLGAFVIISWFASRIAFRATSPAAQYAALGGFVVAEALIFVPMLYIAQRVADGVIQSAAVITLRRLITTSCIRSIC